MTPAIWMAVVITWTHVPATFDEAFQQRQTGQATTEFYNDLHQCTNHVHSTKGDMGYCVRVNDDTVVFVR